MLDDDDFGDAVLVGADPSLPWGCLVLVLVVLIIMGFVVLQNHKECAQMTCADGKPAVLLDHQCLCVSQPGSDLPNMAMTPTATEGNP